MDEEATEAVGFLPPPFPPHQSAAPCPGGLTLNASIQQHFHCITSVSTRLPTLLGILKGVQTPPPR